MQKGIAAWELSGSYFKQLMKSDKGYMYEKSYMGCISYEVFKRRENKRFNCISYPSSPSFCFWAWDYRDYENALRAFNNL